jgi:hypothetical protein
MAHAVSLAVPRGRARGSTENPWAQCVQFATSIAPASRPFLTKNKRRPHSPNGAAPAPRALTDPVACPQRPSDP